MSSTLTWSMAAKVTWSSGFRESFASTHRLRAQANSRGSVLDSDDNLDASNSAS